jgi:hexosaminidase
VYPPKEVIVSVSDDGKTYKEAGRVAVPDGESKVIGVEVPLSIQKGVDMKVTVKRFGVIPAGEQGAGHEAWLFVDEIVVE